MRDKILKKKKVNSVLRNIKLIVYDFDGVFTDNKVILREDGLESVIVNRADGLAIGIIKDLGIRQIILTTETNRVVEVRAKKLGIPVVKGVSNKKETLIACCKQNNIHLQDVAYVGNDLNDLEVMKIVGFPLCPSDACEEIKSISKIVLSIPGGGGVAKDLIRYIDKNSGKSKGSNCS